MSILSSPYIDTELYERVLITPQQIQNDIYIYLKDNLKKKIEKKCNKYGYITKVYKILDHSDGEIVPENFDASLIYNVKYSCRLCRPIENTDIVCKIELMNKSLIKASNGPIICVIGINYINNKLFSFSNSGQLIYNNNKIIKDGDHIITGIRATNYFAGDERIIILGELKAIPSKDDIEKYYKEKLETENIIIENEYILDDDNQDDKNSYISDEQVENDNYINL